MKKGIVAVVIIVIIAVAAWLIYGGKNSNNNSSLYGSNNNGGSSSNQTPTNNSANNSASTDQTQSTNKVTIANMAFSPSQITVNKGDTVTWTNNDSTAHSVNETDNQKGPDSGDLNPGDKYSFTFDQTGTFKYRCNLHPEMLGTVTVTD